MKQEKIITVMKIISPDLYQEDFEALISLLDGKNFNYTIEQSDSKVDGGDDNDLIIAGLEEGAELWKAEYDNCRAILTELVWVKNIKDAEGKTEQYELSQHLAWVSAKEFLEKYQHQ